jgi:nuclear cap-binding protein subunit 1
MLGRVSVRSQEAVDTGSWREFKLLLRFLGCLQGVFEGDGVFPLLDELFSRAADQQTASQEDTIGLELVKIILMTLPYALASAPAGFDQRAQELLDKTEIIAMVQHPLEDVADPYPIDNADRPFGYLSALELLQKQLVAEAQGGWKLACIPRLYKRPEKPADADQEMGNADAGDRPNHAFPALTIPSPVNPGPKPVFPETYFSIYADQEVESVPRTSDIAATLIRDAIVDTINVMDFNRIAAAKYLIEIDCFFAPGTFLKRGTPFDRIREAAGDTPCWKPEDLIVDALFSQMLLLPSAEHKLVYYNSVITEACKVAPAAIAPTLGRAIRFLFRHIDSMDLELSYRFLDWFAHHLSNFDFRWKWTEWYVCLRAVHSNDPGPTVWTCPRSTRRRRSSLPQSTRRFASASRSASAKRCRRSTTSSSPRASTRTRQISSTIRIVRCPTACLLLTV